MIDSDLKQKIHEIIQPILEETKLELVECKVKRQNKRIIVDIIADRPEGGINIDECAFLNRRLADEVENLNLIADDYVIEVSSPGLDRPLKGYSDFRKVKGREVRFHLSEMIEGKIEYAGIVLEANMDHLVVRTKQKTFPISYDKINKAVQVIS